LEVRGALERGPPVKLSEDQLESNPAVPRGSIESKPTWRNALGCSATSAFFVFLAKSQKEGPKMSEHLIKIAPETVAYADRATHKLVVEFAIPGAPTETIDVKILGDSIHMTAPARDIEYVAALALAWEVKPDKAEAIYEHGLLRIEVPFKDPMEDAVKLAIKTAGAEAKPAAITAEAASPVGRGGNKPPASQSPPVAASHASA
jgi:HSP20 family molecular chaperone IbpA